MLNSLSLVACIMLIVFLFSVYAIQRFRQFAIEQGIVDTPNARSSHTVATPRGGGLVFVIVWGIVSILLAAIDSDFFEKTTVLLPGALIVAAIGYIDDSVGLSPTWRASVHFSATLVLVYLLEGVTDFELGNYILHLGWLGTVFAILATVWSVNLFNFMDGTDGLAAAEVLFILGIGGTFLWQAGGVGIAVSVWIVAASVGGFLVWNWPKASVFMGDVGSGFLGFLIATFALAGEKWYGVPALLWAILYVVFWFDATATLIRRVVAGECWYSAHRSHAYQRLYHHANWSHTKILWAAIVLNILFGGLAIYAFLHHEQLVEIFFVAVGIATLSYLLIERIAPMQIKAK